MDEFEEWRAIPGWEGFYEASSLGRIRSVPHETVVGVRGGRIIKTPVKYGSRRATLSRHGYSRVIRVARLIAETFHGQPRPGQVSCHLDGDVLNNLASNIGWGEPPGNKHKTHCEQGHPFDETNTYRFAKGKRRFCRKCRAEWQAAYKKGVAHA